MVMIEYQYIFGGRGEGKTTDICNQLNMRDTAHIIVKTSAEYCMFKNFIRKKFGEKHYKITVGIGFKSLFGRHCNKIFIDNADWLEITEHDKELLYCSFSEYGGIAYFYYDKPCRNFSIRILDSKED
jgi:hypothetical protein